MITKGSRIGEAGPNTAHYWRGAVRPPRLLGPAEIGTPVLIGLGGGGHIQLGDGNFAGALFGKDPESLADNSVILDFLGVPIAEHQNGLGVDLGYGWRGHRARRLPRRLLFPQARHFLVQAINLLLLNLAVLGVRGGVVRRGINVVGIALGGIGVAVVIPANTRRTIPIPDTTTAPYP